MADYDLLYQDTYIDALLATANELKTAGYIYKGVATPSTNPGTPTERVAYLASEPGTYTNFGGIVIASGLYSLTYASGTWTGTQMSAGSDIEVVQTTGQSTSDVMSQKAVTDALNSILSTGIEGLYDTISEASPQLTTWNQGVINTTTGAIVSSNYRCYSNAIEGRMVTMTCKVISDNYYIHSVIEYSSSVIGTDSFVKTDIFDSTKTLREYSVTTDNYVVFVVSNVANNVSISPAQANSYAVIKNQYEPVASLFDKTDGLIEDRTTKGKEIFYSPISSDAYGYIDYLGELHVATSTSAFYYTELLDVFSGDVIYITAKCPASAAVLAAYDENEVFLSSIRGEEIDEGKDYKFIVTKDVKYVKLTINRNGNYSCTIDRNYNALLNNSNYIKETFTPISQAWGYVGTDGVIVTRTDQIWVYTYPIKVSQGDMLSFVGTSASGSSVFAGYSSDDLTTATDVKIGSPERYSKLWQYYVVPEGVDYVRITHKYAIDGNITVTHFQRTVDVARKSVSVLFIGNSLTQDSVTYLPLLMREIAPEVNFKFYIWYNPGFDLAQQYDYFVNNTPCSIFSVCENGSSWANYRDSKNMQTILQNYEFDIVSLQEYFYRKTSYTESDLSDFNNCIDYIQEHYSKPFKVATLFHAPIRNVAESCFNLTKEGCKLILSKTVAENLIPTGVAVYRALSTNLDSLGSQGHLSPDGIHTQEGLPCMMQAYVTAMWLFKQIGLPYSIANSKSVVGADNFFQMNIPGPNPPNPTANDIVIGTSAQVKLSQKVAVLAFKEGEGIENDSFSLIDNR